MIYYKIEFNYGSPVIEGYQEIYEGYAQRLTDLDGNTLELVDNYGYFITDTNPPFPSWGTP
jgi:hypothetical protein